MKNITVLFIVALFFMSIGAVFLAISANGLHFDTSGPALSMLLFFIGSISLLVASIFIPSFALVDLLVIYFVTISFGFSGYYQVATGVFPWPKVHTSAAINYAVLIYLVFISSYLAGHAVAGRKQIHKVYEIVSDQRFFILMCVLLGLAVICLASGGGAVFTARASEDGPELDGLRPQLVQIGKCLSLTVFLFLLCVWLDKKKFVKLVIFAGVVLVVSYNPVTSPRFQVVAAGIATASVFFVFVRLKPTAKALIYFGLFLANYIIFGPLKSLSSGFNNVDTTVFEDLSAFVSDYAYRVDFDATQISANAVTYFDYAGGFNFGYNIFAAFFFFVPRVWWPSKPPAETIEIHDSLGYEYLNLSFPLPLEFYAAAGLVSVVALAFVLAYMLKRKSMQAFAACSFYNRRVEQTVFMALAAGYAPIVLRGALNGVAPLFGFSFVAYFVIVFFNRRWAVRPSRTIQRSGVGSAGRSV